MAVQLVVDYVGVAELDETYTFTWSVTSSTDMPPEIFVHKFSTEEFDHVANGGDLIFPTVKDPLQGWYRLAAASANYKDIDAANAANVIVLQDLQTIVDIYKAGLATFLTPVTVTFDPTP